MRSGDNMRDLFYQSPYLRRFTSNYETQFSNEKHSANKENISPLSANNLWLASNSLFRSGGATTNTNSTGNTVSNTPIGTQKRFELRRSSFRVKQLESPAFALSLIDSASPDE